MSSARLAVITAVLLLAGIGPASAHVTVDPSTTVGGDEAVLSFRVPTESDTASTTEVQLFLPSGRHLEADVQPKAGWTSTVKDNEIDWKADSPATAIKPGEFEEFDVSVGPLPKTGTLAFKALQTYSDGSVVRWIDTSESAAHPAPTLTLTAGHVAAPASESRTPLVLSIVALVVALGAAGLSLVRRRA